jgi:class 3 adenylate cyclase/TolB-like protein
MVEERIQRRLAAILAADMVGYSRLMEADERATIARLKAYRAELIDPKITEHHGRLVKTTGDGLLVEFGSAVEAVLCALEIQQAVTEGEAAVPNELRISYRVGINLGDIVIDGDDILGDGINVAARLESLCAPGEVYVSGTVHDHVEGKLAAAFDDLGMHKVKNLNRPIHVYGLRPSTGEKPGHTGSDAVASGRQIPSIAVLPFENISGDPEQEYFADGLTEDIITALSVWRSFPVVSRNATFAYKGRAVDLQRVGRDLGVEYLLEGSVRKSGDRVRVIAQLIDVECTQTQF